MNITCPRCGFSRQVPADRLPARAVIATCPHCSCRFRFAPDTGVQEVLPDAPQTGDHGPVRDQGAVPASHDVPDSANSPDPVSPPDPDEYRDAAGAARDPNEDDPLPPGAIVPGSPSWSREDAGPDDAAQQETAPRGREQAPARDGAQKRVLGAGKAGPEDPADHDDDPRAQASRAYEREQNRRYDEDEDPYDRKRHLGDAADDHDGDAGHEGYDAQYDDGEAGIPWETAPEPDGWLPAFYHTCMRVMFSTQRLFSQVRPDGSQMRALIFYLLVSVVQVVVERVWSGLFMSLMAPSAASDPQLEKMLILLSPQMSLPMIILIKTGMSVIQLYVLSALINFTYGFVRGRRADFGQVFQVLAYAAAPTLLCVVPLLGSLVGFVWMVACVLIGCRAALRLTWPQTLMGLAPVILLIAPLLLQIFQAARM